MASAICPRRNVSHSGGNVICQVLEGSMIVYFGCQIIKRLGLCRKRYIKSVLSNQPGVNTNPFIDSHCLLRGQCRSSRCMALSLLCGTCPRHPRIVVLFCDLISLASLSVSLPSLSFFMVRCGGHVTYLRRPRCRYDSPEKYLCDIASFLPL